jgi:copper chaperone
MIEYQVSDMTCGHCVSRVTKAVKEVDGNAQVDINLDSKRVRIESSRDGEDFAEAIREAGYTPQPA